MTSNKVVIEEGGMVGGVEMSENQIKQYVREGTILNQGYLPFYFYDKCYFLEKRESFKNTF